jgi:L-threonylcarbamoyladenylate synthase
VTADPPLRPPARIVPSDEAGIALAARLLREGQVVGIPTETVYGLAGNAFDEGAVARIFAAKERPTFDPLIVHLADFESQGLDPREGVVAAERLDAPSLEVVRKLAEAFWPGPLTLVLPRSARVPDLVTSGMDTVGVRLPDHPVARAILRQAGVPLAAPSANRFGRVSPTRARHVVEELGDRIPLVVDGGESGVGVESTVLRVEPGGDLRLLRPGGIPVEAVRAVTGRMVLRGMPGGGTSGEAAQLSPGMLESHYAPALPVRLLSGPFVAGGDGGALPEGLPAGTPVVLLLQHGEARRIKAAGRWLAEGAGIQVVEARALAPDEDDVAGRARALFRTLRELDARGMAGGARLLLVEPPAGETGLLHAIHDRLKRASAPRAGES